MDRFKKSIRVSPLFTALTMDLVLFVPIDTLFFTMVKGLDPSQIMSMIMFSLIICLLLQKITFRIISEIGDAKSIRVGAFLLFLSTIILTFGSGYTSMLFYRTLYEISFVFVNMSKVLLKNNLVVSKRQDEYHEIRNYSNILYAVIGLVTCLISGFLFNINHYWPLYGSILLSLFAFLISFYFKDSGLTKKSETKKTGNLTFKKGSLMFMILLSAGLFFAIAKTGEYDTKLFLQYDLQSFIDDKSLITFYITVIVLASRIVRIAGNIILTKLMSKLKHKMSIVLSILTTLSFIIAIIGHLLPIPNIQRIIIMGIGFLLLMGTRDTLQVYIEDTALKNAGRHESQKVMLDLEMYRKVCVLILSAIFAIVLDEYNLLIVEILLVIVSIYGVIHNYHLFKELMKKKLLKRSER